MESEKVKEIKKALECNADYEHHDKLSYIDGYKCKLVAYADIITYINELERDNEVKQEHLEMWFGKNEEKKKRIAKLENTIKDITNIDTDVRHDLITKNTVEAICQRLEKWGGYGRLYAIELRKEYGSKLGQNLDKHRQYLDKAHKEKELVSLKSVATFLNEFLECPCKFTFNDKDVALYMGEHYEGWCEENCAKHNDYTPCWEMYLKAKLKERE